MNVELYSTKTIKQINTELTTRFNEKETRVRPGIQGFVEKGGAFHLTTQANVMGIRRTTRLRAAMERSKEVTVIRGYVNDGVQPEKVYIVMAALGFIGLTLILKGQAVFGVIVSLIAIAAYIPMVGDYNNSQYLVRELKRLSGAREKPPTVGTTAVQSATRKPSARKPAAARTTLSAQSARPKAAISKTAAKPAVTRKPAASR